MIRDKNMKIEDKKIFKVIKNIFKKILIGFFSIKLTFRSNQLKRSDYVKAKKIIEKGDLILVGDFKSISGLFIGNLFTHSLLYIGKGKCIHAGPKGVQKMLFKDIFKRYDTFSILRPNIEKDREKVIAKTIRFAKRQLGQPYDIFLEGMNYGYFCTNLINCSFGHAGFDTGVGSKDIFNKKPRPVFWRIKNTVRADYFLRANFLKIFASQSLYVSGRKMLFFRRHYLKS